MARSARTSNPVTLFPFLAVLLCTIGALVLMLVVVSAGIRKDAVATAKHKSAEARPEADRQGSSEQNGAAEIVLENRTPDSAEELPKHARQPIDPLFAQEPPDSPLKAAPPRTLAELAELERTAEELKARVADRSAKLRNVNVKTQALLQQLRTVKAQQEDLEQAIIRTASERKKLEQSAGELRVENQQIIEWLDESRRLISEHAEQLLSPVHSIVPYDGQTGTVRRPIIIECVDDVVRFEAEQVEIPVAVLQRFSPEQNPLLAGVQALSGYWMAKEQIADPEQRPRKPYALILVRPSGAEAFSSAVFALDGIVGDFGYELVESDFQYELPETTPDAIRECRAAVEAEVRRGPIRSRRALSPQGPVDISRVARGPMASRGFFNSVDFRNRTVVASDGSEAGKSAEERVLEASGGGDGPDRIDEPRNAGVSRTAKDELEAELRRARQLLQGRLIQGSDLLQKQRPADLQLSRSAAAGDLTSGDLTRRDTGSESESLQTGSGSVGDDGGSSDRSNAAGLSGSTTEQNPGKPTAASFPGRNRRDVSGQDAAGDESPPGNKAGSAEFDSESSVAGNSFEATGTGDRRATDSDLTGDGQRDDVGLNAASSTEIPDGTRSGNTRRGSSSGLEISSIVRPGVSPPPDRARDRLDGASEGSAAAKGSADSGESPARESGGGDSSDDPASPLRSTSPSLPALSRSNEIQSLKSQKRWGLSHPDASLGLEKVVVITIETGRVVIGNQFQVTRRPELSAAQVVHRTILSLEEVARRWGWPPPRFYWVPSVKLEFDAADQQLGNLMKASIENAGAALEQEGG